LWLRSAHLDTADTSTSLNSEFDVSLISPCGRPGVLYEVVLDTVLNTPSDSEDTVIELSSTGRSSDNSRLVLLEDSSISFDGNGNWSSGKESLHLIWVLLWNISIGDGSNNTLVFLIFACEKTGLGSVWIVSLSLELVGLSVLESEVHETTIATVVQP